MSNLIQSAITKLLQRPNKKEQLIFGSEDAIKTYNKIKKIATKPALSDHSFLVLSSFLQRTDLSIFTKEELEVLLSFDYSYITGDKILPNKLGNSIPMYDVGGTIINLDSNSVASIYRDFLKIHSINKSLSLEYLVSYIINQL